VGYQTPILSRVAKKRKKCSGGRFFEKNGFVVYRARLTG